MQPIAERMDMSKASHLAVPKHQRPPIWTEEAIGFHKRVKRIHDPVKIVVPCAVFETESPTGWRYHYAIRQAWGKEEEELEEEKKNQEWSSGIIDPSLLRLCQEIQSAQQMLLKTICKDKRKKIQGRRVDIPEAIDDNMPLSVDRASRVSIDRHLTVSIDAHHQRSEKKKEPSKRLPSVSTDANLSTLIDIALPESTDINILTSVDIHSGREPKLISNTKPDTIARLGAWFRNVLEKYGDRPWILPTFEVQNCTAVSDV
uniref:Uncharacterized protein n=1 Tax=Brassica oleracea var. oleracea TaxID=109376 RepID=A0A0D3ATU7_BRAOL